MLPNHPKQHMLSVVVPVFNEEESIKVFYEELLRVAVKLDKEYELIFVDDGSTDGSFDILKGFEERNNHVLIFSFRKNQGKAEALTFGFQKAQGDYIITLDADLQDKPSEIPKLLNKINEGWEMVCGWRKNRKDSFFTIAWSKIFNFAAFLFWGIKLHDYNCGLKVYTDEAAKSLTLYGGMYRFIPLLLHQQGFKVGEIEVMHDKRKFGKSKYGPSKLWKDMPDIFTMLFLSKYGKRPLHFFGTVGGIMIMVGFVVLTYLTILRLGGEEIGRRPLLIFGVLFMLGGIQVFFTGFLADLMINLSHKREAEETDKFLLKYSSKA